LFQSLFLIPLTRPSFDITITARFLIKATCFQKEGVFFMPHTLKTSLQRVEDAHAELGRQLSDDDIDLAHDAEAINLMRKEHRQLGDMIRHLQLQSRPRINDAYLYNMVDSVLEHLRQYLQDVLTAMLQGGKNETNRDYVRLRDELRIVEVEQERRKASVSDPAEVAIA
jgi:hypothetical protein